MKDLTKELQGKWHHVYFDNLFTSHSLLSDLEKSMIHGCGTARKDRRGFPEKLKQNLRTGKIHTLHKQKLDKQFGVYTMHGISHHKYGVIYSL